MKTAVVILNYNSADLTIRLAKKIAAERCLDYIIIVDNKSTDESVDRIKQENISHCDIIEVAENKGYAAGNNIGCKYAIEKYSVDYIFISNPDVIFGREYVECILAVFEDKKEYSVLTGLMKYPDGRDDKRQYLLLPQYWEDVANCYAIGRKIVSKYLDRCIKVDYSKQINEVEALPGSLFAIRSETLKRINFFDENTFLYYEENILGIKLKQIGTKLGLVTQIEYLHDHSATIKKNVQSVKRRKIINQSVLYYEREYRKTKGIKMMFLKISLCFALVDAYIVGLIKKML